LSKFLTRQKLIFVTVGTSKALTRGGSPFLKRQQIIAISIQRLERLGPAAHHFKA
jgi:hypothetical protein